MATQTFTSISSDWLSLSRGLRITLRNVFPTYFQVIGHAVSQGNGYANVLIGPSKIDEFDLRWNNLFADPRSEDVFSAFAAEARAADESELWTLDDSDL